VTEEAKQLTVAEFDAMVTEFVKIDDELDELAAQVKVLNARKRDLNDKLCIHLQDFKKTSYQVPGATVSLSQRASVATPKTREEKEAFFSWLKNQKGDEVYWAYLSVNSQSLNSFYKAEREAAREVGDIDFTIPGVGKEAIYHQLSIRRKK
jgi:hypothetical protein